MNARDGRQKTRGWGRPARLGLFALVVALVTFAAWRATSLRGLPDIGDPFDLNAFYATSIPDDENAWTFFKRASDKITKEPMISTPSTADPVTEPTIIKWLGENQEVLALWVEGAKRDRAMYTPLKDISIDTLLPGVQNLRSIARLGLYEGALRESKGDLAGAWEIYRTGLRSGRLCGMNGTLIERLVGIAINSIFAGRITTWAQNPKVTAPMLKTALADALAAQAMTSPSSTYVKVEYSVSMHILEEGLDRAVQLASNPETPRQPSGPGYRLLSGLYSLMTREPERSRRVFRLYFANWLSACDLPSAERLKRLETIGKIDLYRIADPVDPHRFPISNDELSRWIESSTLVKLFLPSTNAADRAVRRDEATMAALVVTLAEQLALRETGKYPESPESLVGTYLKAVPDGYIPLVGPPEALKAPPKPIGPEPPSTSK